MRKTLLAALAALALTAPVRSETIGISGFLGMSPGVCSIVPTDTCISYLFVAGTAERICAERPRSPVRIVGHSMGGSGAMDLLHRLRDCGVRVSHVVALDPQAHPYDIPRGTRVLPIYSRSMAGIGEGHADTVVIGVEHITLSLHPEVRSRVRSFMGAR